MTQPHPQPKKKGPCETCESFKIIPPAKTQSFCEWGNYEVNPNGNCLCIPSHYIATHTPAAPATERLCDDGCSIFELEEKVMNLEQELKGARKDEREKVLADEIIPWIEQYCFKPAFGESVVPKKALCKFLKSLRGGVT